jgi:hypothetical protein
VLAFLKKLRVEHSWRRDLYGGRGEARDFWRELESEDHHPLEAPIVTAPNIKTALPHIDLEKVQHRLSLIGFCESNLCSWPV